MIVVDWMHSETVVRALPGYRIQRIVFWPEKTNSIVWDCGGTLVRCVVVKPVECTQQRRVVECEWIEESL